MRHYNKVLVVSAIVLLSIWIVNGTTNAHVLQQRNGISGVLHMPPSDEPRAGEKTSINIAFGDKSGKFNISNCNCTLTVSKDGTQLTSIEAEPQQRGAKLSSRSTYTFPKVGAYDITLTGSAKDASFSDFTLTYVVRVATDATSAETLQRKNINSIILIISGGLLAGIVILGHAAVRDGRRYQSEQSVSK